MEPLRGGTLAVLSDTDTTKLRDMRSDETVPAWAFRFLQSIPNVVVTLSGMSNFEQLKDNIRTFETENPLSMQEMDVLCKIADDRVKNVALPCTACRYCLDRCPQGLNIPDLMKLYNEHCYTIQSGRMAFIAPMAMASIPESKRPGACSGCGSCEAVCPQQIKIADAMVDFMARLNG
jgi:predicted aldo/keto reductase-like oxidoreductase